MRKWPVKLCRPHNPNCKLLNQLSRMLNQRSVMPTSHALQRKTTLDLLAQAKTNLSQAQNSWDAANSAFNSGSFRVAYNDYEQSASSADAATNAAEAAKQQLQNARNAETCIPFSPGGNSGLGWLFWLVVGLIVAGLVGGVAVQASKKAPQAPPAPASTTLGAEYVHCIYCGSKIAPSASFCDKCGRAQH